MATPIHGSATKRLYLREHRKHRKLTPAVVGSRMGIHEKSVLRLENDWRRVLKNNDTLANYTAALSTPGFPDLEPKDLYRPPPQEGDEPELESVDAMIADQPTETKKKIVDIVKRLLAP